MLVDWQILESLHNDHLQVRPADGIETRIQPASLDVRLGDTFAVFRKHVEPAIDPREDTSELLEYVTVLEGGCFVAHPGELILAATLEEIGLPDHLAARVEGKSSLGRLGLLVHATAGFIDPGWPLATITLELTNVAPMPLKLWPGMRVCQLAFEEVLAPKAGYAGKYVSQQSPAPSRYHENWLGSGWA